VVNATDGNDVIRVVNHNGVITVSGLASDVTITNFEANDRLVINGLGGNDVIDASGLTGMLFTADGGDGNDVLVGSTGNDVLNGDAGNDLLIGDGGQDALDGGTGHNTVFHSAGNANAIAAAAPSDPRSLALLNQFMASSFVTAGDGQGGMPIADPQPPQQPLLTQPHA
jgi:Ca2+-binding RTX toxin-like protein